MPIPSESERARPASYSSLFALPTLFLLSAGLPSCGPSVQSIYEGNVRFEHCYRLDLEVAAASTYREGCWNEWLGMYTYGQSRDRIEYARRRVRAFALGDPDRPTLDLSSSKQSSTRQFYLVVPAPTNAHASPQPVATRWYGDAGAASPTASSAPAPEDECSDACRQKYNQCSPNCRSDSGQPDPACKNCDADYKACMKRCFR